MVELDYERMQEDPNSYFNELSEMFKKENKEIREQVKAINSLKTLLGADIQGPSIMPLIQPSINTILKNETGSLEQVLENISNNSKSILEKRDRIEQLENALGRVHAKLGMQGETNKSLNSAVDEVSALHNVYAAYFVVSEDAAPIIKKYLKI